MKRKIDEAGCIGNHSAQTTKKPAASDDLISERFRRGLFDSGVLESYQREYARSKPYKHGVIRNLISDELLQAVRNEIRENLHFSPKETDIYKIYQSGDLANLDGLDDSSLSRLPSLLKLRDALYSTKFREELAKITGSGPLSGEKTDMAINVYTPGCYLLCHDDVIGSRRVSYILYLTDPDKPWKAEWGGALRLYATTDVENDGQVTKVPDPEPTISIPPSFNQLSFFAVQPGQSFHDVEEVYAREPDNAEKGEEVDGGRVRMAISGWFHIPQQGEEGYTEGLEEELAEKSSLVQLQGKDVLFDRPQPRVHHYDNATGGMDGAPSKGKEMAALSDSEDFTETDLDLLIRYITPTYLTPYTLEEMCGLFTDESSLKLKEFLSPKFSARLKAYIEKEEQQSPLPEGTHAIELNTDWHVARPPHKHRFLYQQAGDADAGGRERSPLRELYEDLFPSNAFRKWLSIATSLTLDSCNVLARRFRRGSDYSLATGYGERERIELTLGITPTSGWDACEEGGEEDVANGKDVKESEVEKPDVGGYEIYYADDNEEEGDDGDGDDGIESQQKKKAKADPAVYKSSSADEDGSSVLFSSPAAWNSLSIVLRDHGVLRFMQYVSRQAPGDRWDITGEWGVAEERECGHGHGSHGHGSHGASGEEEGWESDEGEDVEEEDEGSDEE